MASDSKKVETILEKVKNTKNTETLKTDEKDIVKIVIALLKKIKRMQKGVMLDDTTAHLIRSASDFRDIVVSDENIVDLDKLSFSDTFEIVMKKILEISIKDPNHKVLQHVYRNLVD